MRESGWMQLKPLVGGLAAVIPPHERLEFTRQLIRAFPEVSSQEVVVAAGSELDASSVKRLQENLATSPA